MMRKNIKNSKKGFSLPLAIGITAFLILISASLLFIASNSISNTSVDVNSRQAYLNLKSALYYSKSYYEQVDDITQIGTKQADDTRIEYIIMKDKAGGTVSEGAEVSDTDTDTKKAATYVVAQYTPASVGSNQATLKLSAYANYSDAFGNKGKTAHMNYTIAVADDDSNTGRITGGLVYDEQTLGDDETVTLNVKKPSDLNWAMATYIYSYKDVAGIYKNKAHYESYGVSADVNKINQNEKETPNVTMPAGPWTPGKGPMTAMVATGNNWYSNTFHTRSSDVHYFNVILTKIGADLSSDISAQSPEMFHLWYMDPQDKNIYFEILKSKIYYYTDTNWNGKTNLEDTVLVYVKNPKTTVHVMVNPNDVSNATVDVTDQYIPVLNNIKENGTPLSGQSYLKSSGNKDNNNIKMQYEGCGWWVANVESGNSFSMNIAYNNSTYTANVSSSTNREAWLVLKDGSFTYYSSEETACEVMGVEKDSYVTVHAKASDYTKDTNMKLSYSSNALLSSVEREKLRLKIIEAQSIDTSMFEAESVAVLAEKVNEGVTIYNDEDYIKNAPGPANSMKIKQAANGYNNKAKGITAIGYNQAIKNIDDAIAALKAKSIDASTYKQIEDLLKDLKKILDDKSNYDYDKIVVYQNGIYDAATKDLDNDELTLAEALEDILQLNNAISDMQQHGKLNKAPLQALINKSEEYVEDTKYPQDARETFKGVLEQAKKVINAQNGIWQSKAEDVDNPTGDPENPTKIGLNQMRDKLNKALNVLKKTYQTPLNTDAFNALVDEVSNYIAGNPTQDYTQAGFDKLSEVYNRVENLDTEVSTTQAILDNATKELQEAFDNCKVKKPLGSSEKMYAEDKKIRVYVDSHYEQSTYFGTQNLKIDDFAMYEENNKDAKQESTLVQNASFAYDESLKCHYYDVDVSKYDSIYFVSTEDNRKATSSIDLTEFTDGNIIVKLSYTQTWETTGGFFNKKTVTKYILKSDVSTSKMTTLYLESYSSVPKVTISTYTNKSFECKAVDSGKDDGYDVVRFPYEKNYTATITVDNRQVSKFTVKEGEWVIRKNSSEPLAVSDIYPIYKTNAGSGVNYTISTAVADGNGGYTIQNVKDPITGNMSDEDQEFLRETFDVPLPDDSCIILLDLSADEIRNRLGTDADGNASAQPYIETFTAEYEAFIENGSGGYTRMNDPLTTDKQEGKGIKVEWFKNTMESVGAKSPGYKMTRYKKTQYYYAVIPKAATCFKINGYDASTGQLVDYFYFSNMNLRDRKGGQLLKEKQLMVLDNGSKYWTYTTSTSYMPTVFPNKGLSGVPNYYVFSYHKTTATTGNYKLDPYQDTPTLEIPTSSLSQDDINEIDLKMPFVGGRKVRITNKPYNMSGKTDGWNVSVGDSNPYGGTVRGNNCHGRVGDSQLNRYVDWTEYKIPVPKSAVYSFAIKGLNNNDNNTSSVKVNSAMSDIWVTLNSKTKNGEGKYSDIKVYTFNPDEETSDTTKRVYFDVPSGWNVNSLKITDSGIGYATVHNMTSHLSSNPSYYYYDVDVNKPFITFTITDNEGKARSYKTCIQGGDYVLYRPDTGATMGGNWDTFVSAQDSLYRAVSKVQSMYYGNYLVKEYEEVKDASDKIVSYQAKNYDDNFIRSPALRSAYINYSSQRNGTKDDSIDVSLIQSQNETTALSQYNSIQSTINSYSNLYTLMRKARSYIEKPLVDGRDQSFKYPEYFNNKFGSTVKYTDDSINNLRRKYDEAYRAYRDAGDVNKATRNLKVAISSLEVTSEGAITIILYDAQNKLKSTDQVKLYYQKDGSATYTVQNVTDKNDEGFPGIRVTATDISNVAFHIIHSNGDEEVTAVKDKMKENETWVLVDKKAKAEWQTLGSDYRDIKSDEFTQNETESMKFTYQQKDEKGKYIPLILNFLYNTKVSYNGGSYEILAGQYVFDLAEPTKTDKVVLGSGDNRYIDLYSKEAQTYFSTPENYGSNGGVSSDSGAVGWTNSGAIANKTNFRYSKGNISFIANSGVLAPTYAARTYTARNGSIYFRWNSTNPLKVNSTATMVSKSKDTSKPDLIIAVQRSTSSADIIGTTLGSKFYLKSSDSTADSMVVEFKTDTRVSYKDGKGNHNFFIRAGIYEISKADKTTDYIANIFDESYWLSHENIKMQRVAKSGGGSSGSSKVSFGEGSFS